MLGIEGTIETDAGEFTEVGQLPKEPFRIVSIKLDRNRQVKDENLEHLKGLTNLTFSSPQCHTGP